MDGYEPISPPQSYPSMDKSLSIKQSLTSDAMTSKGGGFPRLGNCSDSDTGADGSETV